MTVERVTVERVSTFRRIGGRLVFISASAVDTLDQAVELMACVAQTYGSDYYLVALADGECVASLTINDDKTWRITDTDGNVLRDHSN